MAIAATATAMLRTSATTPGVGRVANSAGHLLASVKIGYLELRERSHIYLTVYFIDGNRCSPRRG